MKVILDTSVIIAALFTSGASYSADIIKMGQLSYFEFIVSQDTFAEVKDKLNSDRLKKLKNYNKSRVNNFLIWYKYNSSFSKVSEDSQISTEIRDKKDEMYLHLALESQADYIISLDNHLLELNHFLKTKIRRPDQFVKEAIN
jgi:putative PIN family toxin of toxin-antitoxin system